MEMEVTLSALFIILCVLKLVTSQVTCNVDFSYRDK